MANQNILIIAGEPSGDIRAGELLKHLKPMLPGYSFWGIGGNSLSGFGMELIEHVRNLSIVGVWEAIMHLPKIHRQYKDLIQNIKRRQPKLAILVDYPGFNLKIAKYLKENNIPVIYYVIPQVWAWGADRINLLKKYTDDALVLFKFEEDLLKEHGIRSEFAGHPLVDRIPENIHQNKKIDYNNLTVALLPGSRKSEIINKFSAMLGAARKLSRKYNNIKFVVAESSNVDPYLYSSPLKDFRDLNITQVKDNTFRALDESDFAMVTSGTATLETTVMNKPMVILYKTSFLTAFVARLFIKVKFLGLVNIIAKKEVVPELYQDDVNPEKIYEKLDQIIEDKVLTLKIKEEFRRITEQLGDKGAGQRAATRVTSFLETLAG